MWARHAPLPFWRPQWPASLFCFLLSERRLTLAQPTADGASALPRRGREACLPPLPPRAGTADPGARLRAQGMIPQARLLFQPATAGAGARLRARGVTLQARFRFQPATAPGARLGARDGLSPPRFASFQRSALLCLRRPVAPDKRPIGQPTRPPGTAHWRRRRPQRAREPRGLPGPFFCGR